MNDLLSGNFPTVNGSAINGRGVKHLKLSRQELIALAADVASGVRPLDLSLDQTCMVFGLPVAPVRAELKVRAANGNGNGAKDIEKRFVETWELLSHAQRKRVIQIVGVAEVWDVLANVVG
jgi:hypothetical protein